MKTELALPRLDWISCLSPICPLAVTLSPFCPKLDYMPQPHPDLAAAWPGRPAFLSAVAAIEAAICLDDPAEVQSRGGQDTSCHRPLSTASESSSGFNALLGANFTPMDGFAPSRIDGSSVKVGSGEFCDHSGGLDGQLICWPEGCKYTSTPHCLGKYLRDCVWLADVRHYIGEHVCTEPPPPQLCFTAWYHSLFSRCVSERVCAWLQNVPPTRRFYEYVAWRAATGPSG